MCFKKIVRCDDDERGAAFRNRQKQRLHKYRRASFRVRSGPRHVEHRYGLNPFEDFASSSSLSSAATAAAMRFHLEASARPVRRCAPHADGWPFGAPSRPSCVLRRPTWHPPDQGKSVTRYALARKICPLAAVGSFLKGLKKTLDYDGEYSYLVLSPKSHVPMGVRRTLELVRKSVRYLELTPPVAIPANRKMRGRLSNDGAGLFVLSLLSISGGY
jgi:hypothetical protein